KAHRIPLDEPFDSLSEAQRELLLHGAGAKGNYSVVIERESVNAEFTERFTAPWPGLCGHVDAWHAKTEDPEWAALLETVMATVTCPLCKGERLGPDARAATVDGV